MDLSIFVFMLKFSYISGQNYNQINLLSIIKIHSHILIKQIALQKHVPEGFLDAHALLPGGLLQFDQLGSFL